MQELIDQIPGIFAISDQNAHYQHVNQHFATTFGFNTPREMLGIEYSSVKCDASQLADTWVEHDAITFKKKTSQKIIEYLCTSKNTWRLLIGEKKPFIDHNHEQKLSLHFTELTHLGVLDLFPFLKKQNGFPKKEQFAIVLLKEYPAPIKEPLSPLESACLFFLLRGKTLRQMSHLFNLSIGGIEKIIYALKCKFNCFNKNELIATAIERGYINFMPETLFYNTAQSIQIFRGNET